MHRDVQVALTRRAGAEACRQVSELVRPVSKVAEELGVCWWTAGEPPRRQVRRRVQQETLNLRGRKTSSTARMASTAAWSCAPGP